MQQPRAPDGDDLEAAFDLHAPRVMGFALRLTGSRAEAEDLVQDTFVAALAGRGSLHSRSKYLPWLLGIAARRWRDRCRRPPPSTVALDEEQERSGEEPAASGRSPEEQVVAAMTLEGALSRLSPSLRESLLLVASQGLSYKEAAQLLGEPVGTVKWRVSEASRRMRQMLSQLEEECHDESRSQTELKPEPSSAEPPRELPATRADHLARGR